MLLGILRMRKGIRIEDINEGKGILTTVLEGIVDMKIRIGRNRLKNQRAIRSK